MKDREERLLNIIASGLAQFQQSSTQQQLGDRASYIGMSDVASYFSCPRAAVLKRAHGHKQSRDLPQLLTLSRGHWFESGVAQAFDGLELPHIRQLEISTQYEGVDFKAHLDFVLATTQPRPTVRILEVKSCQKLPAFLYSSYEMQVYGQIGLLAENWNKPCFSYIPYTGAYPYDNLSFPSIANIALGTELPWNVRDVDLEAWVLCLSMQDAKVFGPYVADSNMLKAALDAGVSLWKESSALKEGQLLANELKEASGYHPLCSHCNYAGNCPKFVGLEHPELQEQLEQLITWKSERSALDEKIKQAEGEMKEMYAYIDAHGQWVSVGNRRFRVSDIPGRRSLDRDSLAEEIGALFALEGIDMDVSALFSRHEKVSLPSSRLTINTLKG